MPRHIACVVVQMFSLALAACAHTPHEPADPNAPRVPRTEWPAACEAGDAAACNFLGMAHENGFGAEHDPALALTLYRKACELGSGWGCFNLTSADSTPGANEGLLRRSCDLGYAKGCARVARDLTFWRPSAADAQEALALFERACDLGLGEACHQLAQHLAKGALGPRDPGRAHRLLERACEREYMEACFDLGSAYLAGSDQVAQDVPRALELFTKACGTVPYDQVDTDKMPSGEACQALAAHVDPARARELLSRGCQFGAEEACVAMAERLEQGKDGLPLDPQRGLSFLRYTCDQREAHLTPPPIVFRACDEAGLRLRASDPATAAQLFQLGCDGANGEACNHLARALLRGEGLASDPTRASKARTDACHLGSQAACAYIRCSITLGCDPSD